MSTIYLITDNETGHGELCRAPSKNAALIHYLRVRDQYEVTLATKEDIVEVLTAGQPMLDSVVDSSTGAADAVKAFAERLDQVPSMDMAGVE